MTKGGLGKGLDALFPGKEPLDIDYEKERIIDLEIAKIKPNPCQPRKTFSNESLKELADSIKEHGIIQPVIVRPVGDHYELITGERRLRACKLIKKIHISAVIRESSDREMAEVALIENIQREDLNPLEEARAYQALAEDYGLTQEEIAKRVGKSRSAVTNFLRVLRLPELVLTALAENKITLGHARTLLALNEATEQIELFNKIYKNQLSVRDTEKLVKNLQKAPKIPTPDRKPANDVFVKDVAEKLAEHLGTKVLVTDKGNKGKIEIEYYSEEDLERILDIIIGG